MPSSRASTIPYVINVIKQLQPSSILDVGVGFGKWGYLFREYTDIIHSEHDAARYLKTGWRIILEGIEGYKQYLHPAHDFIYDKIHLGTVQEILPRLGTFDIVFFGDIIEHLSLQEGQNVLREAITHAKEAVIVTTPRYDTGQQVLCNNILEKHRSLWGIKDFAKIGNCKVALADRDTLVVMYARSKKAAYVELKPERPIARSRWFEALRDIIIHLCKMIKPLVRRGDSHERRNNQT